VLNYLVTVTEDLLITVTLISLILALCRTAYGRRGLRIQLIAVAVGIVLSAAMAAAKNLTSKIATNQWNFYIFLVTIFFTLLFMIASVLFGRKEEKLTVLGTEEAQSLSAGGRIMCTLAAILTVLLIFYEAPDVLGYPVFGFYTAGAGIFSVDYAVRLVGYLAALILLYVYGHYLYCCAVTLKAHGLMLTVLNIVLLINAFRDAGLAMGKWVVRPKKWLHWLPAYSKTEYPWAFPFVKFVGNHTLEFSLLIAGIALLIPLVLFVSNLKVHGYWSNPAEHRKLKAGARRCRKWAAIVVVCLVIATVNLTVIYAYLHQEVVLSEPETYTIEDGNIYISLEDVSDGHLHRFEYTTDNNIAVRWIVVKKPGGSSYGVGLDACDVCGDAGYYERGEQIVCKRCDVVMNINTIGFKGGCNPIPLASKVESGYIVIALEDIIAGEKEFK